MPLEKYFSQMQTFKDKLKYGKFLRAKNTRKTTKILIFVLILFRYNFFSKKQIYF